MDIEVPTLGIDFGTTYSKMAWFNPKSKQAEIIKNSEREEQTPSVVYYGKDQTVVGKFAQDMLEDPQEFERVVISAKRDIANPALITLPDDRTVEAVDVATEILRKLKRDAEEGQFHEEVTHVVITCPATFDSLEQGKIRDAALRAGFKQVELMKEPVAAALAYARMGLKVGKFVLVYDLGGGTFDLAILAHEGEAYESVLFGGDPRCGGDDFDDALYNYCDQLALQMLQRPISITGRRDLYFLHACQKRKEDLSRLERKMFSSLLTGGGTFRHELDRATFEGLIGARVRSTVQQTQTLIEQAKEQQYTVDTMVLVGGSSSIPLIERSLKKQLSLTPYAWQYQNIAVALGAAYHAHELWNGSIKRDRYRVAVNALWATKKLDQHELVRLAMLAANLGLDAQEAAAIETEVMGVIKEQVVLQDTIDRTKKQDGKDGRNGKAGQNEPNDRGGKKGAIDDGDAPTVLWEGDPLGDQTQLQDVKAPPPPPVPAENFSFMRTLIGHGSWVRALSFSPIAYVLASGSDDRTIRLWDLNLGKEMRVVQGHVGQFQGVTSVTFSPSGWLLLSGGGDKIARLWSLPNWEVLHTFEHNTPYGFINAVALGQNQQLIATASDDSMVRMWNAASGAPIFTMTGHQASVTSVAFSPIGFILVSGSLDHMIRLWNIQTGQSMGHLFGHNHGVRSVAFSPDGLLLASGSDGGTIKLWDLQKKKLLRTLRGHSAPVWSVAINYDGKTLASGSVDGTVKLWNVQTGMLQQTLTGHNRGVRSVAFSLHGNTLASGGEDGSIRLWRRALPSQT